MIPEPDKKDGLKPAKGILIALLLVLWAFIFCMFFLVLTHVPLDKPSRALPAAEKVRYDRLLAKHGFAGKFSVIEVRDNGRLFFYRNGRRCELR